jgi:hypothetical protein
MIESYIDHCRVGERQMRFCCLVAAVALVLAPEVVEAKGSKATSKGKLHVLYVPLSVSTLKPITEDRLEVEGDGCVVSEPVAIDRIFSFLSLARPAQSEQEEFANRNVRIKIWRMRGARKEVVAIVEQDGCMLAGKRRTFLPKKSLEDLAAAVGKECFGYEGDPFKSKEFLKAEEEVTARLKKAREVERPGKSPDAK